jgi:Ser/Thr protein kinase RdoA (MazF antagonist)
VIAALAALLGATAVEELGGGHQSRVFRVSLGDGAVVAKVYDPSVDRHELDVRLGVVSALADRGAPVCRPLRVRDRLVHELGPDGSDPQAVVCFELATGRAPDPADRSDAALMGRTLAGLHASMRELSPVPLPAVAALRDGPEVDGARQLLHGDFNAGNLRVGEAGIKLFDLDDCGYGQPLFEVADALYMVRFDAVVSGVPATFEAFAGPFVAAYEEASGAPVPADVVAGFVDRRVGALAGWLDDLGSAPVGVRTASPEWRATLRTFVDGHRGGR